jgi:hypothetical protein
VSVRMARSTTTSSTSPVLSGRVQDVTAFERLSQALHAFLDASLDPDVRRIILIDGPAVLGWVQ